MKIKPENKFVQPFEFRKIVKFISMFTTCTLKYKKYQLKYSDQYVSTHYLENFVF